MESNFRFNVSGDLIIQPTAEALKAKQTVNVVDTDQLIPFDEAYSSENPGATQLQYTKYKGKSFEWVLVNDPSVVIWIGEMYAGKSMSALKSDREKTLFSLFLYGMSFPDFDKAYGCHKRPINIEDCHDKVIAFGPFKYRKYKELYESRVTADVKYISTVRTAKIQVPRSGLAFLQDYVKYMDQTSNIEIEIPDDDLDLLESDVLLQDNLGSASGEAGPSPPAGLAGVSLTKPCVEPSKTKKLDLPVESGDAEQLGVSTNSSHKSSESGPLTKSSNISSHQRAWILGQLKTLGLNKNEEGFNIGSPWKGQSLFRLPPSGEAQHVPIGSLPKPEPYQIHPCFLWFPTMMFAHLMPDEKFHCIYPACTGKLEYFNVGNARVVIGSGNYATGMPNMSQYYMVSSELKCDACQKKLQSSDSRFLESLSDLLLDFYPAYVSYNKMVCKSIVDIVRRGGRSLQDISDELNRFAHGRYELQHKQYLSHAVMMRNHMTVATADRQNVISVSEDDIKAPLKPFGSFEDVKGYHGSIVSVDFLRELLLEEYKEQRDYLKGLQKGIYGTFFRTDHTSKVAHKVQFSTGAKWSFAIMNEYMQIVSWVLVDSDSERQQAKCWAGLKRRYDLKGIEYARIRWVDKNCCADPHYSTNQVSKCGDDGFNRIQFLRKSAARVCYSEEMDEKLDGFHLLVKRIGQACTSESHSHYASFMQAMSDAIYINDPKDYDKLVAAWAYVGGTGKPPKTLVRRHCKNHIPPPDELVKNCDAVFKAYESGVDSQSGLPLFSVQMENTYNLQRTHMTRGCVSDPEGEVIFRVVKEVQLRKNKSSKATVPVYTCVRSSSQLEGFHFHQNRFVTGDNVRGNFWQAQVAFEVCLWNIKRATEHLFHTYPRDFNPKLLFKLNDYHQKEMGFMKYPDVVMNFDSTDEVFGFEYLQSNRIDAVAATLLDDEADDSTFDPPLPPSQKSLPAKRKRKLPASSTITRPPSDSPGKLDSTVASSTDISDNGVASPPAKVVQHALFSSTDYESDSSSVSTKGRSPKPTSIERSHALVSCDDPIQLHESLQQPRNIQTSILPKPDDPSCSSIPLDVDVDVLVSNIQPQSAPDPTHAASSELSSSATTIRKRVRPPKHEFQGTSTVRRCATPNCGGFKKSTEGEGNLHYTWKRPGEPCIFYCPLKMHNAYNTPVDWSWDDFMKSPQFEKAKEDAREKKKENDAKKKALAAQRASKGHKKSGPQPKKEK